MEDGGFLAACALCNDACVAGCPSSLETTCFSIDEASKYPGPCDAQTTLVLMDILREKGAEVDEVV